MTQPKPSMQESGAGGKVHIFVVDDEPMLLELAAVILEPLGYVIKAYRDPGAALEAYRTASHRPELIITDYAMHSMNGLALMDSCRKLQPGQKVLLVSGTVDDSVFRNARNKPDRFLAKPYQARQLVEIVAQVLKG